MTPELVIETLRQALMMAFWLAAPLLLVGFAIGIVVSLIQIVTSIQDSGFNTIPRLAAFLAALLASMPWMLKKLCTYTTAILGDLGRYAR
jgi:flagellar biosynthetic protein FliQ